MFSPANFQNCAGGRCDTPPADYVSVVPITVLRRRQSEAALRLRAGPFCQNEPMRVAAVAVALLLCLFAGPAHAQLRGTFTVGVAVSSITPTAAELSTSPSVRPTIGRMPSRGWGLSAALNWFEAEVTDDRVRPGEEFGTISVRPLMLGVGFTHLHGRIGFSPSFVAGPALNTVRVRDGLRDEIHTAGSGFERHVGTITLAVRPGINVTYALSPRVGLGAFAGYLFNRPSVLLDTPGGEIRTRWSTDGFVASGGVVVAVF